MNAANTVNWTRVPADPWASTIKYVDLTQRVTVGMWCNSDSSVGLTNDPAHCRTTRGVDHCTVRSSANHDNGLGALLLDDFLEIAARELVHTRRNYRLVCRGSKIFGNVSRLTTTAEAEDHRYTRRSRRRQ